MSDTRDYYVEWVPYRLTRRLVRPQRADWGTIPKYQEHLAGLGIDDDPTKATEMYASALQLRDAANRKDAGRVTDIADAVAAGDMSVEEVRKAVAKRPDRAEAEEQHRKVQRAMNSTAKAVLLRAVLEIHEHGLKGPAEGGWLALLRPLAEKAIAERDQATWNRLHLFAKWLRSPSVGVCGLAAAMANNTTDADFWLYMVGDAGVGLYRWRVARSNSKQANPSLPIPTHDGRWRIAYVIRGNAPFPTVHDFAEHPEWAPGLYSADEVIANQARAIAEQDRELARLDAPPKDRPTRRAAFI
jgi:hypothetical protein